MRYSLAETEARLSEHWWRESTFGGFLVAREAVNSMVATGTRVFYIGATGSLCDAADHTRFASAKRVCARWCNPWTANTS